MKEASKEEIKALIGLIYLPGLKGVSRHEIEQLFSAEVGPNVFDATMLVTEKEVFTVLYKF